MPCSKHRCASYHDTNWRPPVFRPDLIFHHTLGCMRFIGQIKSLLSLDNTFCRRSGGPAARGLRQQLGCWTTKKMSQNCSHQPQPRQHLWQAQPPTLRPLQCSRMWRSSIAATRTMAPQRLRFPSLRGPTSLCPGAQAPPKWNRSQGGRGICSRPRGLRPTGPHLGAHASPGPTRSKGGAGRCCGVRLSSTSLGSRSADCFAPLLHRLSCKMKQPAS